MRIPDGDLSRCVHFVAVDDADFHTRETGLTGFTVYYAVDGGTAAAMTTPTVTELSSANMPGVYALDIDEAAMVAVPDAAFEAEVCVHITKTGMDPVTRVFTIYRDNIQASVDDTGAAAGDFDTTLPQGGGADHYKGCYVKFAKGTLENQVRKVTGSTWGTKTNLAFSDAFTAAPANGDTFELINR